MGDKVPIKMESLPSKLIAQDAGAGRVEVGREQLQQGGPVGDRGVGLQSRADRVTQSRGQLPPRMLEESESERPAWQMRHLH